MSTEIQTKEQITRNFSEKVIFVNPENYSIEKEGLFKTQVIQAIERKKIKLVQKANAELTGKDRTKFIKQIEQAEIRVPIELPIIFSSQSISWVFEDSEGYCYGDFSIHGFDYDEWNGE